MYGISYKGKLCTLISYNIQVKVFLLFSILLFSSISLAGIFQIGTGGITPHFSSTKKNYCNQWNNTGIIVNKSYYIGFGGESFGITYMKGNDSICSPVEGIFLHYIMNRTENFDVGITFGGYEYDTKNWDKHAEETPADIDAPSTLLFKIEGKEIVPVLALEVGLHLIRRESWSLKLNNLFTPIIFNHSIAFEYRF